MSRRCSTVMMVVCRACVTVITVLGRRCITVDYGGVWSVRCSDECEYRMCSTLMMVVGGVQLSDDGGGTEGNAVMTKASRECGTVIMIVSRGFSKAMMTVSYEICSMMRTVNKVLSSTHAG